MKTKEHTSQYTGRCWPFCRMLTSAHMDGAAAVGDLFMWSDEEAYCLNACIIFIFLSMEIRMILFDKRLYIKG